MKKACKAIGITLLILVLLLIVFLLSVFLYHRVMLGKEKPLFSTPHGDMIEVDGGVNLDNAPALKAVGADILVAGNAVFGAADIPARVKEFKAVL